MPYDEKQEKHIITITRGSSSFAIGLSLAENNLIYSPLLFVIYTKITFASKHLQAGQYELYTNMSMAQMVRIFTKGSKLGDLTVTIPEGYTLEQITILLNDKNILVGDRFKYSTEDNKYLDHFNINRNTLEGYLFPDTYHLFSNINSDKVVEMMINRFQEVAQPIFDKYAGRTKLTLDQAVILASIIEKEAGNQNEMRTVSSVFHNRLKRGMMLQSEATVRYATKKFNQPLTVDDLKSNSLYNTYKYMGLPVGPICNPGASSLDAALNPENTQYLYFMAKNDGAHTFSLNLAQHEAAVSKYKKLSILTTKKDSN